MGHNIGIWHWVWGPTRPFIWFIKLALAKFSDIQSCSLVPTATMEFGFVEFLNLDSPHDQRQKCCSEALTAKLWQRGSAKHIQLSGPCRCLFFNSLDNGNWFGEESPLHAFVAFELCIYLHEPSTPTLPLSAHHRALDKFSHQTEGQSSCPEQQPPTQAS